MNVRGAETYNDTEPGWKDVHDAPLKLRAALKAVELYLGTCRPVIVRSRCAASMLASESTRKPIVALWHSSLVYMLYHSRHYTGAVMTSPSKDGEWIARAVRLWGQHAVRGSRFKGGLSAIRHIARLMKERNYSAGIVADGSRGPANVAQLGAVILARETGCPIFPTGFAASRAIYFNSWDRLILPLPFSRVCVVYNEAITVPADARGKKIEYYRKRLENALNSATKQARIRVGLASDEEVGTAD